jgi:hypothetical protein
LELGIRASRGERCPPFWLWIVVALVLMTGNCRAAPADEKSLESFADCLAHLDDSTKKRVTGLWERSATHPEIRKQLVTGLNELRKGLRPRWIDVPYDLLVGSAIGAILGVRLGAESWIPYTLSRVTPWLGAVGVGLGWTWFRHKLNQMDAKQGGGFSGVSRLFGFDGGGLEGTLRSLERKLPPGPAPGPNHDDLPNTQ